MGQIRDAVNPNQKLQNYIQIDEALVVLTVVIMLVVVAGVGLHEIEQVKSATNAIGPNMDTIITNINEVQKQLNISYETSLNMPLLTQMSTLSDEIEGNLRRGRGRGEPVRASERA